ncbi:hypothetical protein [Candidatus Poriferisodalis sp.]|uniref:hypothetical protein n=1 Tax=Candidatus Poriferisodalis sp. TaxID=3101277 RepID=UPI003D0DBC54
MRPQKSLASVVMICRAPTEDDRRRVLVTSVDTSRPAVAIVYEDGHIALAAELTDFVNVRPGEVEPPV